MKFILIVLFIFAVQSNVIGCHGSVCKALYEKIQQELVEGNQKVEELDQKQRELMMEYQHEKDDMDLIEDAGVKLQIREKLRSLRQQFNDIPKERTKLLREIKKKLKPLSLPLQYKLLRDNGLYYRYAPEYNAADMPYAPKSPFVDTYVYDQATKSVRKTRSFADPNSLPGMKHYSPF